MSLESFKDDLISGKLSEEEIFQRHIVDGQSYFFSLAPYTIVDEYKFKSDIAKSLGVTINQVVIVGSAKLGYSLNPKKLFEPFDSAFLKDKALGKRSDIDVAVVSHTLFERVSQEVFDFTDSFSKRWGTNSYYTTGNTYPFDVPLHYKYHEYFSKGWFRPDLKPNGYEFCVEGSFQSLKASVYKKFNRKIGLGIYKDWHYFKSYHLKTLNHLIFKAKRTPL